MSEFVDVEFSLRNIYSNTGAAVQRYREIADRFRQVYGKSPQFFARAPGRVNIIGEHIDYSGYSVFPMAIENDAVMAVCVRPDTTVNLKHMYYVQHTEAEFEGSSAKFRESEDKTQAWVNYFVAGYRALADNHGAVGMDIIVDGNVPLGSGLSSSASLVVCSAVATLHSLSPTNQMVEDVAPPRYTSNRVVTKNELAELAWKWEVKVGTACGGMDQTISVLAQKGTACLISFNPIQVEVAQLPENAVLVMCDSLSQSIKQNTLGKHYNKRVVECRLAVTLMKRKRGITIQSVITIKGIQDETGASFDEMLILISEALKPEPYTKEELTEKLH